jgi:ribosomal protein S18 acetylase RimI-like enzyme
MTTGTPEPVRPARTVTFRPGREADLAACIRTWKAGLEGYMSRLGLPPVADDLGPLRRLLNHTMSTDPDRFWVAVTSAGGEGPVGPVEPVDLVDPGDPGDPGGPGMSDGAPERVIGFASATVRESLWFLAMLFVNPEAQAEGTGSALMDRAQAGRDVDPGGPAVPCPDAPLDTGITTWGMGTDTAQPISNGLYARRGMLPRVPVWRLFGEPRRWSAIPALSATLESVPFESLAADGRGGAQRLAETVAALDREIVGMAHPQDHEFLRRDGRTGFLVRERGSGRALGYGYGSSAGRLGPVAALDPALHPAILGAIVRETPVLGPVAIWVPGTAAEATRALLHAGLRFDGFPALVCWSTPTHPFDRYLPISLALV